MSGNSSTSDSRIGASQSRSMYASWSCGALSKKRRTCCKEKLTPSPVDAVDERKVPFPSQDKRLTAKLDVTNMLKVVGVMVERLVVALFGIEDQGERTHQSCTGGRAQLPGQGGASAECPHGLFLALSHQAAEDED